MTTMKTPFLDSNTFFRTLTPFLDYELLLYTYPCKIAQKEKSKKFAVAYGAPSGAIYAGRKPALNKSLDNVLDDFFARVRVLDFLGRNESLWLSIKEAEKFSQTADFFNTLALELGISA